MPHMPAPRFLRTAALALALSACADATAPSNQDVVGRWNLDTINGASLPFMMDESELGKLEIARDDLILKDDGTLGGSTTWRIVDSDGDEEIVSVNARGTWARVGSGVRITFSDAGNNTTTGALAERSLTLSGNGFTFVYRR